jgi:hypothetical protein
MPEADAALDEVAAVVRPAVHERVAHGGDDGLVGSLIAQGYAGYATHIVRDPGPLRRLPT